MYLKSIELSGFKSFAKKSLLEFETPVTAVVGPNGSGKSNVAEAFRFVLGEQSIKSMRGKRGEDLIWNGTNTEPRANRASVRITFRNVPKIFPVDFEEVSIERVVHRDGVNEYLINGSQVRLKDVLELLAAAHIGASGHHIISQGEADKILSASPKERKGMIEDALGLKIYQYKRAESERKLEKTFENIQQVEGLRKEIAPHLRFLKKQAEKIEKAESLREDLTKLAYEYFKRENVYITHTKTILHEERKPIEAELEKLSKESSEAKKILEFESSLTQARADKDAIVREIGKIEGLIAAEERMIETEKKLTASNDFKTIRLVEVEKLLEEISFLKDIVEIIGRVRDFVREHKHTVDSKAISDAQERIAEFKKEKSHLEETLRAASHKEAEIADAEKAVFRTKALENELISRLNTIKSKEELLKHDEEEFRRELEEVSRLIGIEALQFRKAEGDEKGVLVEARHLQEERKRELSKLKIRLEDSGISGSGELLKEYQSATERDEFLARELEDLHRSAESLRELIKELEARLSSEFATGLTKINREFGKLFELIFGGGGAELELVKNKKPKADELLEENPEDEEVEEGLDVSVNLPRKKIKSLMMLSGGERALTSIALLFAITAVNPPPFIILDETDAALDEANSKKYGDMAEELAKHSQLILITHNRETMSRAGVIYGVTMGSTGVSKLLSIAFDEAVQVAK